MKRNTGEDIRWMQLSDLHIGSPDCRWTDKTLKERLRYFLEEGRIPRLQFIIITGDLVNKCAIDNKKYVEELYDFIDILKPFTEKIIITPGNHDYKRNESRCGLLRNWEKELDKKKVEDNYSRKLVVDFEECEKLFEDYSDVIFTTWSDVVVLDEINIIALNTSIFSGQPSIGNDNYIDDDGKIWISDGALPDFKKLNTENPSIMIGHHPFEMFSATCIDRLKEFSMTCGAKYYFCGHMHKNDTTIDSVTQYTSAGLFNDAYNTPSFAVYFIKKRANETINEEYYVWDGDWTRTSGSLKRNVDEKDTERECVDSIFAVTPSEISDGALRIPYAQGKVNIYVSKDKPGTITVPHKHDDIDEITYVTKGSLFIVIDDKVHFLSEGSALLMPKGKFHGFIDSSFPCEYITMSVEAEDKYDSDWQRDINTIHEMDKELLSGKCDLEKYDDIIDYIGSSVMEVRWEAEAVLNKRLVQENNSDNDYIRDAVGKKIRPALRSNDLEKQFFGLSVAYELGINIQNQDVTNLLKSDSFMVSWVCAYYVIKLKMSIDLKRVFKNLSDSKVYQRAIIAVLQLIVKHDSSLLRSFKGELDAGLSLEDILTHFTIWYTSFTFMDQELDYKSAAEKFKHLFDDDGDKILRGFTNIHDDIERVKQIQNCKDNIIEAASAYFENIHLLSIDETEDKTKERIENYLRIIVSDTCNLQCVYCHHEGRIDSLIGADVKRNQEFDLRELLRKAKKLNFKKIKISGGEPLLYPDVLSICNEFEFEDIGFTTNGTQIGKLRDEFSKLEKSKLTFNVTLNSLDSEKNIIITGADKLQDTLEGIDYLIDNKFSVKINSVITSYNIDEVVNLVSYAARQKVNIKFLDLFAVDNTPSEFKHVSISEIKNEVMKKFRLGESDFIRDNDYLTAEVMGIKVMIPSRIYSVDCQYNCKMYPCAEGIFGTRVYEDYSCAKCLKGTIYRGGLNDLDFNIAQVRKELNSMRFSY